MTVTSRGRITSYNVCYTKLLRAFEEITGVKVTHDTIQEGDVIEKLQTQRNNFV